MAQNDPVHVAVGVITNSAGEVLISKRHVDSHQGDLWEFPGGKVDPGETVSEALSREFAEELGLNLVRSFPLKKILHYYQDKSVLLDVWMITDFAGVPQGLEGQLVEWRPIAQLKANDFPAANEAIIQALRLPGEIAISPEFQTPKQMSAWLQGVSALDVAAVHLRQKQLSAEQYLAWFRQASSLCSDRGMQLIFGHSPEYLHESGAGALHLTARQLMEQEPGSLPEDCRVSASCHKLQELQKAESLQLDYVYLSPVEPTDKYGEGAILGWRQFEELASSVSLPIYALGGVARSQREQARQHGAHGIAGISAYL